MSRRLSASALMWFGLLGAPFAFTAQHVAGYFLTTATCYPIGRGSDTHMDAWVIVIGSTATAIAVGSCVAAFAAWRMTRDAEGGTPGDGRVQFMAIMGMTVAPLSLAIIVMSTLGAVLLENCVQS